MGNAGGNPEFHQHVHETAVDSRTGEGAAFLDLRTKDETPWANLSGEEPSASIAHARVCGGRGSVTTPPTRPPDGRRAQVTSANARREDAQGLAVDQVTEAVAALDNIQNMASNQYVSGVWRFHGQNERLPGMAMPLRVRALVLRTEPRRNRVSALAGFDPYRGCSAGLAPIPRPRGCAVTAGTRERVDRVRHGPHAAWGDGAKARSARADHRPLPTSPAFAWGGGSSSRTSVPGRLREFRCVQSAVPFACPAMVETN